MKNLLYLIIFFLIASCSNNKVAYWCGDHQCINKKERETYFKKTMTVEVREIKSESKKNISEIEKITKKIEMNQKKDKVKKKNLAKQIKLEEKRRVQEEKALAKQIKIKEKNNLEKNIESSEKKEMTTKTSQSSIDNDYSISFNKLVEKIIKRNSFRPYPDINDIPN